jgi:hypothetical protein
MMNKNPAPHNKSLLRISTEGGASLMYNGSILKLSLLSLIPSLLLLRLKVNNPEKSGQGVGMQLKSVLTIKKGRILRCGLYVILY